MTNTTQLFKNYETIRSPYLPYRLNNVPNNLCAAWIVGFSDGESTFRISITNNSNGTPKVRAYFSLPQDQRDFQLLEIIKNQFGCGSLYKDERNGTVWILTISSLKDINEVVIPLFDNSTTLQTTKKFDYEDFKLVISMMNKKHHLTKTGLEEIKNIISRMNTKRERSNLVIDNPNINPDWLVGFVDGEGCFYIQVTPNKTSALKYRVITGFSITQKSSERLVLESIMAYLKCGTIIEKSSTLEYRVVGLKDLNNIIIPFFNAYPDRFLIRIR